MKYRDYEISKVQIKDNLPFDLLLLADETVEVIEKYIYDSHVYVVTEKDRPEAIGVFALYQISDRQIEIKNIAVLEPLQGQGLGSYLIEEIKRIATTNKYEKIVVGTPDCSFEQIRFYERNGFKKYDVRKDFFIENYPKPIIENGVMLRDMVMLELDL